MPYKVSYPLYYHRIASYYAVPGELSIVLSQDCFLLCCTRWAIHCTITGLFPNMLHKVSYPLYYHRIVSYYAVEGELSIVLSQDCFLLCCTRWAIHCTITGLFPTMLYKVSYPLYYHRKFLLRYAREPPLLYYHRIVLLRCTLYKVNCPLYFPYAVQGEVICPIIIIKILLGDLSIVVSQDYFCLCCTRWTTNCTIAGLFPSMLHKIRWTNHLCYRRFPSML